MDDILVFTCSPENQRKVVYLMIALDCGVNILDALFHLALGTHHWPEERYTDLEDVLSGCFVYKLQESYAGEFHPISSTSFIGIAHNAHFIQLWASRHAGPIVDSARQLVKLLYDNKGIVVDVVCREVRVFCTGIDSPTATRGSFIGLGQFDAAIDARLALIFKD